MTTTPTARLWVLPKWRGDGIPDPRRLSGGAGIHPPRRVLIPGTRKALRHPMSILAAEVRRKMAENEVAA